MENKDILVYHKTDTPLEIRGDFGGKNVEKKLKILHAGVILEKKMKILHAGVSIEHFQKLPFFTDI